MDSNTPLAIAIMLIGAVWWIGSLYKWLLTPLEDHH
jgi:cytochrome c oxidase subunit 1